MENTTPTATPTTAPAAEPTNLTFSDPLTIGSGEAEATDSSASPESSSEVKAEAKEALKTLRKAYNIKVDGKEIQKEIDLMDEKEMVKLIQLAEMGQKRAAEAAELKKKDQSREQKLQELFDLGFRDPIQLLQMAGASDKEIENYIAHYNQKIMQEKMMSPEEKEKREIMRKYQEAQQRLEEMENRAKEEAASRELYELQTNYKSDLDSAFQESGLVRNPETIASMMRYKTAALKAGVQVSFKEIVPYVKEEIQENIRAYLNHLPEDVLEKLVRTERVEKVFKKPVTVQKKAPPSSGSVKNSGTFDELFGKKVNERTIPSKDFFANIK